MGKINLKFNKNLFGIKTSPSGSKDKSASTDWARMQLPVYEEISLNGCSFKIQVNRYQVERFIGGGSYGNVVQCIDKRTGQKVAIKRIRHPFNQELNARRSYREFELLKIVNHKNIIKLLNAYTPQEDVNTFEEVYLVMEFMEWPLRLLIHERKTQFQGPNGGRQMSFLIYQLLCGVNHLHQAGIAHRDLTPENIMIDPKFQLKIVDLGLAAQLDSKYDRSTYVTQRFYRAPEVVLFIPYGHKVDVWSIGCIFAELLTGSILCPGKDKYDQWTQIVKVVGSPDDDFVNRLEPSLQQHIRNPGVFPGKPWEHLFPDQVFPVNDKTFCSAKNGRDLLSKMLVIDPDRRISASEALKHVYLTWKHHPDELNSPANGTYDMQIETMKLKTHEWKQLIFEKIKSYEMEHFMQMKMENLKHD